MLEIKEYIDFFKIAIGFTVIGLLGTFLLIFLIQKNGGFLNPFSASLILYMMPFAFLYGLFLLIVGIRGYLKSGHNDEEIIKRREEIRKSVIEVKNTLSSSDTETHISRLLKKVSESATICFVLFQLIESFPMDAL